MKSDFSKYYKDIKKALRCSPKAKQMILQSVQADVDEYIEANPEATLTDIQNHFGAPNAYAQECIASMDNSEVYRAIKSKNLRNRVWLYTGIAVVLIVAVFAIGIAITNSQSVGRQYSEEIYDIVVETT